MASPTSVNVDVYSVIVMCMPGEEKVEIAFWGMRTLRG